MNEQEESSFQATVAEIDRLREENKNGGDLINAVAMALGCGSCDRQVILDAVEALKKRSLRLDPKLREDSAKLVVFRVGKLLEAETQWGEIEPHRVLEAAKDLMNELRTLRVKTRH